MKRLNKLVSGAVRLSAKVTIGVAELAYEGVKITGKAGYKHREKVGTAAIVMAKMTAKASTIAAKTTYIVSKASAKTVYDNRNGIAGTITGASATLRDALGVLISDKTFKRQFSIIECQSRHYRDLSADFLSRLKYARNRKTVLLDTLLVGGETIGSYAISGSVSGHIQRAYELAYPNVSGAILF